MVTYFIFKHSRRGGVSSMEEFLALYFSNILVGSRRSFLSNHFKYDNQVLSLLTPSLCKAHFFDGFAGVPISHRVGHAKIKLLANFLFCLGVVVCPGAIHISILVIGRFVLGLGLSLAKLVGHPSINNQCGSQTRT